MMTNQTPAPGGADSPARAVAAVDLGATSGRVMLGVLEAGGVAELVEAHRFPNGPAPRRGHLCWDVDALWEGIRTGLTAAQGLAAARGLDGIAAIGVDAWAVDYVLVGPPDDSGRGDRLGEAIAYRDERTEGEPETVASRVPRSRQYAVTGIAQQVFNTIHQLAAEDRLADLPAGSHALLFPDWVGHLLTGVRRTEVTNASTTGMLDARRRDWSPELLAAAGVGPELFAPLVEPGTVIGTVLPDLAAELCIGEVPVIAVGSHDTASAVAAVPMTDPGAAWISSGTWSLVGLELAEPVLTEAARLRGFTNEAGVGGTVRFLENVMGMWLLSECRREWAEAGDPAGRQPLEELLAAAAREPAGRFLIDATAPDFLPPGDMIGRIRRAAAREDDTVPGTPAQLTRCILDSLAVAYREAVEDACEAAGAPFPTRVHVVGGGSRNALLCELTARSLGVEVVAGPAEASALGNVIVQGQALGALDADLAAVRAGLSAQLELERYAP